MPAFVIKLIPIGPDKPQATVEASVLYPTSWIDLRNIFALVGVEPILKCSYRIYPETSQETTKVLMLLCVFQQLYSLTGNPDSCDTKATRIDLQQSRFILHNLWSWLMLTPLILRAFEALLDSRPSKLKSLYSVVLLTGMYVGA